MNCILIKQNNFYEELCELMLDEELSTRRLGDYDRIYLLVKRYFEKCNFIINIDEIFETHDERTQYIISRIDKDNSMLNTMLLDTTSENFLEAVYDKNEENNINELMSMLNISNCIIGGDCYVINTGILGEGKFGKKKINIDILTDLFMKQYYNEGLMINGNEIVKIRFCRGEPRNVIGGDFCNVDRCEVYDMQMIVYSDGKGEINEVSEMLGKDVRGRVFVILSVPYYRVKILNLDKNMYKLMIKNRINEDETFK